MLHCFCFSINQNVSNDTKLSNWPDSVQYSLAQLSSIQNITRVQYRELEVINSHIFTVFFLHLDFYGVD